TSWFVAMRSIQLGYGQKSRISILPHARKGQCATALCVKQYKPRHSTNWTLKLALKLLVDSMGSLLVPGAHIEFVQPHVSWLELRADFDRFLISMNSQCRVSLFEISSNLCCDAAVIWVTLLELSLERVEICIGYLLRA